MDAQQFFYVMASVALGLFALALIAFFFLIIAMFRMIKAGREFLENSRYRVDRIADEFTSYVRTRARGWGSLAAIKLFIRFLTRTILGRT